jgi:hypothetical protein
MRPALPDQQRGSSMATSKASYRGSRGAPQTSATITDTDTSSGSGTHCVSVTDTTAGFQRDPTITCQPATNAGDGSKPRRSTVRVGASAVTSTGSLATTAR